MRVDKRTTHLGIVSFGLVIMTMLSGCTALSNLFHTHAPNRNANREYAFDTVPRIKELEYRDIFEIARSQQWDSVHVADLGQPFLVTSSNTLADSIIEYAKLFIGVPYVRAGKGPNKFDCSGFTAFVFRHFGYELRATTMGQLTDGWKVIGKPDELKRGDLVFYGGRKKTREIGHVGIVVSNDPLRHRFSFIHATVKLGVTISSSTESYYIPRYITACRILPEQ